MKRRLHLLLLLAAACATAKGPPASRLELREKHHVHKVRSGETTYAIAKKYGVSVKAIAELNELERPDKLSIDQELLIPGVPPKRKPAVEPIDVDPPPAPPPRIEKVLSCDAPPRPDVPASDRGFAWPVDGVVIAKYGKIEGVPHEGLDIAAPQGTPVRAASQGKVLFSGARAGYGLLVIVGHDDERATIYAQNAKNCVTAGDEVKRGDVVGLVGNSGGAATPRVYFELRVGQRPVNPETWLPR